MFGLAFERENEEALFILSLALDRALPSDPRCRGF
jgi:hypothetical protein